MQKCEIHHFEKTGRGVRARQRIEENEVVVEVPDALVLYPDAREASLHPLLKQSGFRNASGKRLALHTAQH